MSSEESYHAVRHGAALARRADRGVIRVVGADAATWLQGLLTNDIEALPPVDVDRGAPGEARYSAYLTPQGRMITDARVVRLQDRILLDVPASLAASLVTRLDALVFAEDVQIDDASAATIVLELHGPQAPALIASLRATVPAAIVAGDNQYGVPGYAIYANADDLGALERALLGAGAVAIDRQMLEVVRIESGRPAFLTDMDTDTIPLEAGIEDRAISFTKGCYVGQEIIVRVTQRGGGRVARKLVGIDINGGGSSAPPARGAIIRAGERDIGRVTSSAHSPTIGHAIALGYVHRDFVEPGTRVTIVSEDASLDATVAATPFVS
jgi:folate-binding protein YgfZ